MKRIPIFLLLVTLVLSSCKIFDKEPLAKYDVDSLLLEKNKWKKADSLKLIELEKVRSELRITKDSLIRLYESNQAFGCNKFYMIVGSFQNENYAERWAEKISGMGYTTEIIPGGNGFKMVSAKGYNNFTNAIDDIYDFRENVVSNAWVYVKE